MASKKSTKKAVKKFKKLPLAGKIAVVVVLVAIIGVFAYLYATQPETLDGFLGTNFAGKTPPASQTPPTPQTLPRGEGDLTIHFVNVGQGDCILILFPDGKDMLIDCGNKSSDYDHTVTEAYISTYVTDGQLDYLMLTHGDEDHVDYLDDILADYDVDNIYMPNVLAAPTNADRQAEIASIAAEKKALFTDADTIDTGVYAKFFYAALTEPDANIYLNIGKFAISGEAYRIDFYGLTQAQWDSSNLNGAERKNAISPIGVLEYNGRKVLLTGDSNEINEPYFMDAVGGTSLDCDVLKVGHHGSETSSTAEFLDFTKCEYAVISCKAEGNTFYHPRQTTLDRMIARNMTIYRTDINGNIALTIDKDGNLNFNTQITATQEQLREGLTDAEIAALKAA